MNRGRGGGDGWTVDSEYAGAMERGTVRADSETSETADGQGGTLVTEDLVVGGMHCRSCALLIEETLAREPAVSAISVDLDHGRATVTFDPTALTVADVCASVAGLGYPATPSRGDPVP